jgi:hypothetical protein
MTLKPVAIQYTCRNPGQTALLWAWQPPPFGHGWIDVKAEPLVRLSEVEALRKDAERYRWLREQTTLSHYGDCFEVPDVHAWDYKPGPELNEQFASLDAAIDSELLK